MVVPGYVSQFTTTFTRSGEYLITCNEYCGIAHHMMVGKLIVKAEQP
jgi:cytochrome c oxidase subunit 2